MQFEMLVLDPGKKTRCENAVSLLYALRSFSRLWKSPVLSESDLRISDGQSSLVVSDQAAKSTSDPPAKPPIRAFSLTLSGEFDEIEALRLPIVEFMKEQQFEHRYITKDEVSEHIACELYP